MLLHQHSYGCSALFLMPQVILNYELLNSRKGGDPTKANTSNSLNIEKRKYHNVSESVSIRYCLIKAFRDKYQREGFFNVKRCAYCVLMRTFRTDLQNIYN